MKLTDINPPLGAHYAVYRIGHGRSTAIVIVARDGDGQWERVGRIPPYLLPYLLDGMVRTDIAVWDADEKSYLNGTALQMVYVAPPPFAPAPPKPPANNLGKVERNWAMWRERHLDNATYVVLGRKYGITGSRVRDLFLKCRRRMLWYILWGERAKPEEAAIIDDVLRDFEIVWPHEGRPHLITPNGKRIDLYGNNT